jgi:hypothetical protein
MPGHHEPGTPATATATAAPRLRSAARRRQRPANKQPASPQTMTPPPAHPRAMRVRALTRVARAEKTRERPAKVRHRQTARCCYRGGRTRQPTNHQAQTRSRSRGPYCRACPPGGTHYHRKVNPGRRPGTTRRQNGQQAARHAQYQECPSRDRSPCPPPSVARGGRCLRQPTSRSFAHMFDNIATH